MRIPAILLFMSLSASTVNSEPLTAADREALLESLEKLRETAGSKVDARFRLAIAAYQQGMGSDDAAMDLYLKCIEKVNFTDQQKKPAEFREWKRKEADRLSDPSFRLALRCQLRWLIITLRASSQDPDLAALATEAQEIVNSIFQNAASLSSQGGTLGQPVTSTVFARAYEIGGLANEDWVLSPIQIEQIYPKIIFPRYRSLDRLETLRAAWIRRIQQEEIKISTLSGNGGRRNALASGPQSAEEEKFIAETLPELQWQMEMDLFRTGDESGAAMRMLQHIEKFISHRSARTWGEEFSTLLRPVPPATTTPAETGSPQG